MAKQYTLGKDMFWIPGFENRYAGRFLDNKSEKPVLARVYSYVSPENRGYPITLSINNGSFRLTSEGGYRRQYSIAHIEELISGSSAYLKYIKESQKDVACDCACEATAIKESNKEGAFWVIGSRQDDYVSFSSNPKIHTTQASAYSELLRLAEAYPGQKFFVFKTVRAAITGEVTITDF